LTALAAVAIVSLPLPTLALTLDTATTMMTAVICDNSGRCTRPASKPQTAPTDLAETMKNEAAAQREWMKAEAAKAQKEVTKATKSAQATVVQAQKETLNGAPKEVKRAVKDVTKATKGAQKEVSRRLEAWRGPSTRCRRRRRRRLAK